MTVDVVLPAGGRIKGELAGKAGTEVKALLPLDGRPVLEHTLAALHATKHVRRLVVIGPDELAAHPAARAADIVLPEGDSGPENIFRGIEWLRDANGGKHAERILLVTTDLPFLTAEAIRGFLRACPAEADICLPVIERGAFEARFPGSINQYVPLRDGQWTLGCAFLVNPAALANSRLHIERAFAARKSQFAMARLLGLVFIARFLTQRLTVTDVERRCSEILGCTGAAVRGGAAELAYDIDEPEHYHYAVRQWGA